MLVAIAAYFIHGMSGAQVRKAWGDAGHMLFKPFLTLIFAVALVRVFIDSSVNALGLPGMPLQLAKVTAELTQNAWPLFAASIGSLGAFVAGSNTVSDLMFALFQFGVATRIGENAAVILGLQAVGGAAGNMIAVHNIVAACATVGLVGKEGILIRRTIFPMFYYLIVAGIAGFILCSIVSPGYFIR